LGLDITDHPVYFQADGDVGADLNHAAAQGLDLTLRLGGIRLAGTVIDAHIRAGMSEGNGGSASDATARARNESDSSG